MDYERVNWENLPSTKTPVNADNLNKLNDAIDQAGAEIFVGTEEPTTGEKVWFRKGKNLFNKNVSIITGYYIDNNGSLVSAEGSWYQNVVIEVNSKTQYTISSTAAVLRICFYDKDRKFISREATANTSVTFSTPENCKYVRLSGDNADTQAQSLQLEQGSKATSYEAYIEPQIFVRNSNGVYEEFIKKHEEVYSTEEVKIGTWVDGKPLYRKVISSTLPKVETENVGVTKTVSIGANIKTGFIETAYYYNDSQVVPIPFIFSSGQVIKAYIGLDGNITLSSNTTYTNEQKVTIIVCYTKKTD